MKNSILIFLIALIFSLSLTSCTQNKELTIEEKGMSGTEYQAEYMIKPKVNIEETDFYSNESKSLDGWLGFYGHRGNIPKKQEGYNGYISINFVIYQEEGEYLGYLNMNGVDDTYSDFYERMLLEIRGTQDMIQVFFSESFSDVEERGDMFATYQKGKLLFSLRKEGDRILTVWENMILNEQEKDLERGFVRQDELVSVILRNTEDRANFLRAFGIMEGAASFYQYYNDDGSLYLEIFYNMEKCVGAGIFYGVFSMSGFEVGEYECMVWRDHKFSTMTDEHDASSLAEYAEYSTFNEMGQLTHFYSKGIIEGYVDSSLIDEVAVKIEFIYREDGTLERKDCWYNPLLFGSTRSTETYFYDSDERLVYVSAYITHGTLEDYYIYEGDDKEPSYRLTVDHQGWNACKTGFVKY